MGFAVVVVLVVGLVVSTETFARWAEAVRFEVSLLGNRLRHWRDPRGFTLIELIIVLIILGILTALAIPSYLGFRDRAQKSAAAADVRAAVPAAEAYFTDFGSWSGMTVSALASYDNSLDLSEYTVVGADDHGYCLSARVGSHEAHFARNPDTGIEEGGCP